MKCMLYHIEAKVTLLVLLFFFFKTMSIMVLLHTSSYILSFGNCSIPVVI